MKKNQLHANLTPAMIAELREEPDENNALRRALLHTILLMEEAKDPAVRDFVDYLLVEFQPLAATFTDEKHPYLAPFKIMRGRLPNGHFTAFLPLERLKVWLAGPDGQRQGV